MRRAADTLLDGYSFHEGVDETTDLAAGAEPSAALSLTRGVYAYDYGDTRKRLSEELVAALCATGGNKSAAARELGVTRMTIINRVRKYGIEAREYLAQGA